MSNNIDYNVFTTTTSALSSSSSSSSASSFLSLPFSLSSPSSHSLQNISSLISQFKFDNCTISPAPIAKELFKNINISGIIIIIIIIIINIIIIIIYIEEILFLIKRFSISLRRKKTIWILAFYPIFSLCGLLAIFIPRSSTLIDLIINIYFSTCLYNFARLIVNYLGGSRRVLLFVLEKPKYVYFNTPPICCCCYCLPKRKLNKFLFRRITWQIYQVIIIRPLVQLIAAVLWTDDSYIDGELKLTTASLYISIINIVSTLTAVYGLMILKTIFKNELNKKFKLNGKITAVQLTLLSTIVPNFIFNLLLITNNIPCTEFLSARTVSQEMLHIFWVIITIPLSILARIYFRRAEDSYGYFKKITQLSDVTSGGKILNDFNNDGDNEGEDNDDNYCGNKEEDDEEEDEEEREKIKQLERSSYNHQIVINSQ